MKALIDDHNLAGHDPAALGRLERGCSPGPDYRRAGGAVFHAAPVDWPDPLHDDAYCGLAGEIVDSLLPFTEASPAAMLLQLLVLLGNVVGRGTWVGPAKRAWRTNEFVLIVGDSSYGRKGTALAEVQDLVAEAFPDWFHTSYRTSLATGEGLVHMMRDPDPRSDDRGAPDRRCLVAEAEFAKTMRRNTTNDTLSGNIRTAWDGLPLQVNTKTAPSQATDYHFSLVGHITPDEFHANLDSLDIANGLLNRFVICASWMSKTVNQVGGTGAQLDSTRRARLIGRLQAAAQAASGRGQVLFDDDAVKLYEAARPALLAEHVGYVAAISRRAPDHLCRLALILSLIDTAPAVTAEHVRAAWACWDYALRLHPLPVRGPPRRPDSRPALDSHTPAFRDPHRMVPGRAVKPSRQEPARRRPRQRRRSPRPRRAPPPDNTNCYQRAHHPNMASAQLRLRWWACSTASWRVAAVVRCLGG